MSDNQSNNKRIAKNTIMLYFRMAFLMLLGLYTSRVVLATLGVEDYGLYNVVGGVVGFLGFLNAALSNGTSRFITYEMGKGADGNVNKVFQNAFIVHAVLALIVLLLAETVGLWFLYEKLGVAPGRMSAAVWVYHLSVLSAVISITQVPYSSLIIAHEKMDIYAYTGIADGILKLLVVYLLTISNSWDKLIVYAFLIFVVTTGMLLFYRLYCSRKFNESSLKGFQYDKKLSKEILGFSSWSLVGNLAHTLNAQGMTIITNMFFGPAVVAARALSITVNGAVMNLINNFRTAANPQIIKLYSSGNIEESKRLMLSTTSYSYYIMLCFSIPIIFSCETILSLWLKEVPEWTVIFVQLILVQSLMFTFDTCFYTGLYASGKVKTNALISPMFYFVQFIVVYILFNYGFSPITLSIAGIITSMIAAFVAKPILLKKQAGYTYCEVYLTIARCIVVSVCAIVIPLVLGQFNFNGLVLSLGKAFLNFVYAACIIFFIGFSASDRNKILGFVRSKFIRK